MEEGRFDLAAKSGEKRPGGCPEREQAATEAAAWVDQSCLRYWTVAVTLVVWVMDPLVAVTVTVNVLFLSRRRPPSCYSFSPQPTTPTAITSSIRLSMRCQARRRAGQSEEQDACKAGRPPRTRCDRDGLPGDVESGIGGDGLPRSARSVSAFVLVIGTLGFARLAGGAGSRYP